MASVPRYVGTSAATAKAYVLESLGPADFLRVFDVDGDGEVAADSDDEKAFVRAVCAAETEVDEHLAASHGAPFTGTIPDSVKEIVSLRCLWCALRMRSLGDAEKAPFRVLYKDTDARLERLKKDAGARIPEKGPPEPPASVVSHALPQVDEGTSTWANLADGRTRGGF